MATQTPTRPDDGRRLTEAPQRTHPGWTRLQWVAADGHDLKTQFRGPGGEIISRDAFSKRVRSGEIPTVDAKTGSSVPTAAQLQDPPALGGESGAAAPEPFDLPDAKASGARPAPGQASAAELALTAQIALVILTSLLALVTRTPELSMSEIEAQAIGVPLANLAAKSSLNRRFGRYLADSSDYTLLGYALYAYGYRVVDSVAARQAAESAAPSGQPNGGFPHAVPTAAPAAPATPATPAATASVGPTGGAAEPVSRPASGGIAAASRGDVAAEAARIVGYRPVPNPRAG